MVYLTRSWEDCKCQWHLVIHSLHSRSSRGVVQSHEIGQFNISTQNNSEGRLLQAKNTKELLQGGLKCLKYAFMERILQDQTSMVVIYTTDEAILIATLLSAILETARG